MKIITPCPFQPREVADQSYSPAQDTQPLLPNNPLLIIPDDKVQNPRGTATKFVGHMRPNALIYCIKGWNSPVCDAGILRVI